MNDLNLVVRTLNESGWYIDDARLETATCVAEDSAEMTQTEFWESVGAARNVTLALVESGYLVLTLSDTGAGRSILLMANLLDFRVEGDPWDTISIHGPKVRTEQKKKADGGGTREVPYDGLLLRLVHRERRNARLEAHRKADEEARAKAQAEAEARRIEEKARSEAEQRVRARALLDSLQERVAGATIVKIEPAIHQLGIVLTFSNGRDVTISAESEDYYPPSFLIDDVAL